MYPTPMTFDVARAGRALAQVSVRNLATAAGLEGRVAPTTVDEVHATLGLPFGDALLLDQQAGFVDGSARWTCVASGSGALERPLHPRPLLVACLLYTSPSPRD